MPKIATMDSIGTKGLNSDLQPWTLPAEFITYGLNFRVTGDSLQSTNADRTFALPTGSPPNQANSGHILSVEVAGGNYFMTCNRDSVWAYDGATWGDISSVAGYIGVSTDDEYDWTSAMLGNIPIINHPTAQPEYWSPQSIGVVLQPLQFDPVNTWADVNKSFRVIRSHNNFLFALNLIENGVEQVNSYRWSHPAALNGLPFTWDETDDSGLASIEQISGDAGAIIDGLSLRDSFCIYSERAITILDFTGGDFVFRARELSNTYGLLNKNCIAEVNGKHYFMSDADILVNDGNSVKSIVFNRIREQFNTSISSVYFNRSFVVVDKASKEILFCVPENESKYPDTAYVYNFYDDSWAVKKLPATTAFAAYGAISVPPITWTSIGGTYDSSTNRWSTTAITPLNRTIMVVENLTGELIVVNPLVNDSGVETTSSIERSNFPLDGHDNVTSISRVYPYMTGSSDVQIEFGSHQFAGGPVSWKPAVTFNPSTDRKIDIRTTGELHSWRISSVGTGIFEISGMTIEYTSAGKR